MFQETDMWPPCKAPVASPFRSSDPKVMADYNAIGANMRLKMGSALFTEGQPPSIISVVLEGRIKLMTASREGKMLLTRVAQPGDLLGLGAALSQTPHEVTALAIEDSVVRSFRQKDFLQFIQNHAEGSFYAAECMAQQFRSVFSHVCRLALFPSIPNRLAHLLVDMMDASGSMRLAQPVFEMPLTHEDLGAMLGSSRETITRALSQFKRTGMLSIEGRTVTILRRADLEAMV